VRESHERAALDRAVAGTRESVEVTSPLHSVPDSSISAAAHHVGGGLGWVVGLIVVLGLAWLGLSMFGGSSSAAPTDLVAGAPDMARLYEILVGKNSAHDEILCAAGVFGRSDGGAVVRPTDLRADLHPYTAEVSFKPVPGTGVAWRGFVAGELPYVIGGSSADPLLVRADGGRVVISRQHSEIPEPPPPVDYTEKPFNVHEVPHWYEDDK
jgi:hypothetical protein